MADHGKATPPEILQSIFLEAFATTGVISAAARIAGISKTTHYRWLADYPEYVDAFAEAEKTATDALIEEARRRATEGVEEPVMYQGNRCYELKPDPEREGKYTVDMERPIRIRKYSDNLLMFLIKGARPDVYRDNAKVEHTGAGGGPISLQVVFEAPPTE